ncbi:hypothetical protein AX16_010760 [Volvariella volvacea WC 439]|nr:hypothetical protein AX16_010760 [Volvariella volvacea WC 439]
MSVSKGIALITGASRGLGRSIALRLAKDGFDIAVNDLPQSRAHLETLVQGVKDLGRRSAVVAADVTKEDEVRRMVDDAVKELGALDVMVANAGICIAKPVTETTVDDWDRIFSVNTRGLFLSYKYAAVQMIAQGRGGRIIGASSVAGKEGEEFLSAYSSTKFAVRGLTQAAAKEWGQYGITVNAYCPGPVDTKMLESLSEQVGMPYEAFQTKESSAVPIGRIGQVEDVANVVSFLASKESGWITGQSLSPNGGRHYD